jgi:hypothetical protein
MVTVPHQEVIYHFCFALTSLPPWSTCIFPTCLETKVSTILGFLQRFSLMSLIYLAVAVPAGLGISGVRFTPMFRKFSLQYHIGTDMLEPMIQGLRSLVELIDSVTSLSHLDYLTVQIILVRYNSFMSALQNNEECSRAIGHFDQLMENSHFRSITTQQLSFDCREFPTDESEYLAHTAAIKALLPLLDKEGILSFGKQFSESMILSSPSNWKTDPILGGTPEASPNIFGHV